jgi:hypothetical protein
VTSVRQVGVIAVDGLRALEVVDAAYGSIANGQPIRLAAEAGLREVG